MAGFNLQSFGASAMLARLTKLQTDLPKELDRTLYKEAQAIFRRSQRIVPVDKGFLRGSGVVEGPRNHEVLIGYGGPAAPYALYVHEDPEARHARGKTYKFLEIPLTEALAGMEKRIAEAMDAAADGAEAAGPAEGEDPETRTETSG